MKEYHGSNVWLFGAGKYGKKYIEEYGKACCKGFVDNTPEKQGTRYYDVWVYSYGEFKRNFDKNNDIICITTSIGRNEIFLQLFDDGLDRFVKVFVPNEGIVDIRNSWNKIISSSLGEDIGCMHWFRCVYFKGDKRAFESYKGFYLDIGAYHPFAASNTKWAYDLGWRGMNIDPNEQSIQLFNIFRPNDININCGISDKERELKYHIFADDASKNSFLEENMDSSTRTKIVKIRNINDVLEEHHIERIDFVNIDVEGFDERIVYSFDWKKYSPKLVLIELLGQSDIEAVLETSIHKKMKEEGYVLKCFYTVTALYVKKIN